MADSSICNIFWASISRILFVLWRKPISIKLHLSCNLLQSHFSYLKHFCWLFMWLQQYLYYFIEHLLAIITKYYRISYTLGNNLVKIYYPKKYKSCLCICFVRKWVILQYISFLNAVVPFIKRATKNKRKNINSIIEDDKNFKRRIVRY